MVNAMRGEIPQSVARVIGKVTNVTNSAERQTLSLSSGETVSARLVIFASGLNVALGKSLGIDREMISADHSVSIGFDIARKDERAFDFEALTYFSERAADRLAYLALFPIGPVKRANLFVYRDMTDPWLATFRKAPRSALETLLPNLTRIIGDFEVTDTPRIRPVDLVAARGHIQPGVVLVGDAFATSCPAAGTGCNKVFTDVERLCHAYVPAWLATPGMGADKIAAFYENPEKLATDTQSRTKAFRLKALATEKGLAWSARRHGRYFWHLAMGTLRQAREGARVRLPDDVVARRAKQAHR
jgi:2-polyprenyl-6-methoxyphenol hydroxylase-like FAD-dependent oxidoreductase